MDQPRAKRATWRLDARARHRVQWLAVAIICALVYFIVGRPWYSWVVETRDYQTCHNVNAHKIAQGITMYMSDWDGAFPPAETWMDAAKGNMTSTSGSGSHIERYFICPRDKSGSPSSYAYNEFFASMNLGIVSRDSRIETRRVSLLRPQRAPLLIEKHGGPMNSHALLNSWNDVPREMTLPHVVPDPTGILIRAGGSPDRVTREQLEGLRGKRF